MSEAVRIGVIGAGWHATQVLIPAIQRCEGLRIVALATSRAATAAAVEARFGYPAVVGHEALLQRVDVDAVVVAAPPHAQTAVTLAALGAGKHVFCETPGPRTLDELAAVRQALAPKHRVLAYGTCLRHAPIYRRLHDLIPEVRAEGTVTLTVRYYAGLRHVVDLARMLLGDVARILAWSAGRDQIGMLEFASGDLGVLHCGGPVHFGIPLEAVEVSGAGGLLFARGSRELLAYRLPEAVGAGALTFESAPATIWSPSPSLVYGALNPLVLRGYVPELEAFAAAIRDGTPAESGIEQIGRAVLVEQAIAQSAAERRAIDVEG